MSKIQEIIAAGEALQALAEDDEAIGAACANNPWFTPYYIREAIARVRDWFEPQKLEALVGKYPQAPSVKRLGLILAGNLPLVGLHDILMGWLSGHELLLKLSSKDSILPRTWLEKCPQSLQNRTHFRESLGPDEVDLLIATGSNNSARYLQAQFGDLPMLLRKNRFSVAVLSEDSDCEALAEDVLLYDGMGCRSVSNVLIPEGFDGKKLLAALDAWPAERLSPAYRRALAYERTKVAMLPGEPTLSRNVIFLQGETFKVHEPGYLQVITYRDRADRDGRLAAYQDQIQCVMGLETDFGVGQSPGLEDFADGVDTLAFLLGNPKQT